MAETNSTHDIDWRPSRVRAATINSSAYATSLAGQLESGALAYNASLLRGPGANGRGNHTTRARAIQAVQRTHGNRAVQRYIQRDLPTLPIAVSVQRMPFVGPLGPLAGSALAQGANILGDMYDWTKNTASGALGWLSDMAFGKPKTFDDLASGNLKVGETPGEITLPKELQEGMQKAWDKSLPGDTSQEQGGILVKDAKDKYAWKAGAAGTMGTFTPNYGDLGKDESLVGVGHTHPYSKAEGGFTDVPFSGADLAAFATDPDKMQMVQSGEGQFVAARTEEFNEKLKDLDDKGKQKLSGEMEAKWDETFGKTKGTFQEKHAAAAKKIAEEYGIVYYAGKGGKLTKQ